jgi:hypothetical protein
MKTRITKIAAVVTAVAAFALGGAAVAQAVSNNNGSTPQANGNGALPQRTDETVLTGDTASKVEDAALANVPAAIERVETDADGHAAYEAHMVKSDGSRVTVYVNKQFEVVGKEDGPPSR